MDDQTEQDEHRVIRGKPYQIFIFASHYQIETYDLNAENEDKKALLKHLESDTPFMPIHVGDIIDGRTVGSDMSRIYQVERIEHQIDVAYGETKHRMVLFVKEDTRRKDNYKSRPR